MRQLLKLSRRYGLKYVTPGRSKHGKVVGLNASGQQVKLTVPNSPSDNARTLRNIERDFRRAGFVDQSKAQRVRTALTTQSKTTELPVTRTTPTSGQQGTFQQFSRKYQPNVQGPRRAPTAPRTGPVTSKRTEVRPPSELATRMGRAYDRELTKTGDDIIKSLTQGRRPAAARRRITRSQLDAMDIPQREKDALIRQGLVENKDLAPGLFEASLSDQTQDIRNMRIRSLERQGRGEEAQALRDKNSTATNTANTNTSNELERLRGNAALKSISNSPSAKRILSGQSRSSEANRIGQESIKRSGLNRNKVIATVSNKDKFNKLLSTKPQLTNNNTGGSSSQTPVKVEPTTTSTQSTRSSAAQGYASGWNPEQVAQYDKLWNNRNDVSTRTSVKNWYQALPANQKEWFKTYLKGRNHDWGNLDEGYDQLDENLLKQLALSTARQLLQKRGLVKQVLKNQPPKQIRFTKTFHGTTQPRSASISKGGWRTDANVTRQMSGNKVYTAGDNWSAAHYAVDRAAKDNVKPAMRQFRIPQSVAQSQTQRVRGGVGDYSGRGYNMTTLTPQQANKYDITDTLNKGIFNLDQQTPQVKAELSSRVRNILNNPRQREQLRREITRRRNSANNQQYRQRTNPDYYIDQSPNSPENIFKRWLNRGK